MSMRPIRDPGLLAEVLHLRGELEEMSRQADEWRRRAQELDTLINSPLTADFLRAVKLEAAHQVERWGADDRAKKSEVDWLWLITYLAAKVIVGKNSVPFPGGLESARVIADDTRAGAQFQLNYVATSDDEEKRAHRIITIAAAALNWYRNRWPGKGPSESPT